jgi:hypothetical protein
MSRFVRNLVHKIVLQFYAFFYLFTPHVFSSLFPALFLVCVV